jgi:GSH-dependent disulfide-bond oxidoreductase
MIELYTWPTPNGHKLHIMLEECALPYRLHPVDIGKGAQFAPEFLKLSPNNKIPAIIDPDGPGGTPIRLFESNAILMYLAEKCGRLLPDAKADPRGFFVAMQWLMFQCAHIGPMLGQAHHFRVYAPEKLAYAIDRYTKEAARLYRVLDKRLGESPYLGGDDYGIADVASFPWIRSYAKQGVDLMDFPSVGRWFAAIGARPAVLRGLAALPDPTRVAPLTDAEREILFGATQYARH